jgi:hypothetical protein
MLGEQIGTEQGKVTTRRVLPGDDYRYIKLEISFEAQGTVYGIAGTNIGTYTIFERVPGQMYGEGQGIIMTNDGQGAIWKGHGIGRADENGTMSFAASVAFQAGPGSLERLNHVLVVAEHSIDMEGNAKSALYEWKS